MKRAAILAGGLSFLAASCRSPSNPATLPTQDRPAVLAVEGFLADVARNVAGDRVVVSSLIPEGVDPHSYEPTPRDVARVADCDILIVNGGGLEAFLDRLLSAAGGTRRVIEASAGLVGRVVTEGHGADEQHEGDPHFWLDPNLVLSYVENMRQGLSQVDPDGAAVYAANASTYSARLSELDGWTRAQVELIPAGRRLLVTNHESLGYFAERYGFRIVGTLIPSVSTSASPSARQLAELVEAVKASGAPAVFLETGSSGQLADQLAREAEIRVITGLYTHSPGPPGSPADSYIGMMRANTSSIVEALR